MREILNNVSDLENNNKVSISIDIKSMLIKGKIIKIIFTLYLWYVIIILALKKHRY